MDIILQKIPNAVEYYIFVKIKPIITHGNTQLPIIQLWFIGNIGLLRKKKIQIEFIKNVFFKNFHFLNF